MDSLVARKMWRTLEPYHGIVYFAPEAREQYGRIGLDSRALGYFASRGAALGPVAAEVIIATFFNFNPDFVRKAIPSAWDLASPTEILAARLAGVDRSLKRVLDEVVTSGEMVEAATLARRATTACRLEGRPLFAANAALDWPDPAHLALWHAITLLREWRGDGHIAALVTEGIDACEALVIHQATGESLMALQRSRMWPDDDWRAAQQRLMDRGWMDSGGELSEEGKMHRESVEQKTDEAAMAPWLELGEDDCHRLRELVRPWSKAIVRANAFPSGAAYWED